MLTYICIECGCYYSIMETQLECNCPNKHHHKRTKFTSGVIRTDTEKFRQLLKVNKTIREIWELNKETY